MIDKSFASEYRKTVDSIDFPLNYQEKILSDTQVKENILSFEAANKKGKAGNYRRYITAAVAAVLVLAVGFSVLFSAGINLKATKEVRIYVASATSLNCVAGARIVFIDKQGEVLTDRKGETVTAFTDEKGEAVVTIPATEDYTAQIVAEGYIPLEEASDKGNYYISPVMDKDTYRAVLTWKEECDLDAHLSVTQNGVTEKVHYFNSDFENSQGEVVAALDTDSETGSAPETITFNAQEDMKLRFSVASYSSLKENSNTHLALSGAKVTLYKGEACVGVYSIGTWAQGNVWCVFEIENSQLTVCDYTYSVGAIREIK